MITVESALRHLNQTLIWSGLQKNDLNAVSSFVATIRNTGKLTANQRSYILDLIEKYQHTDTTFNYRSVLENPQWETELRVIDQERRAWIALDNADTPTLYIKSPYRVYEKLRKQIPYEYLWDPRSGVRYRNLRDTNLVLMVQALEAFRFQIDPELESAAAIWEEANTRREQIEPHCEITNGQLTAKNLSNSALEIWNCWATGDLKQDLVSAKLMGLRLINPTNDTFEQLAASSNNVFWTRNFDTFFDVVAAAQGTTAVILDRTSNYHAWLRQFVHHADLQGIDRKTIKVCFRERKDEDPGFNDWVKQQKLNGPVDQGEIFIFLHKPAKWLFKREKPVKLIVTNSIYPSMSKITRDWMESHPLNIYLGDIRPSSARNKKIDNL